MDGRHIIADQFMPQPQGIKIKGVRLERRHDYMPSGGTKQQSICFNWKRLARVNFQGHFLAKLFNQNVFYIEDLVIENGKAKW